MRTSVSWSDIPHNSEERHHVRDRGSQKLLQEQGVDLTEIQRRRSRKSATHGAEGWRDDPMQPRSQTSTRRRSAQAQTEDLEAKLAIRYERAHDTHSITHQLPKQALHYGTSRGRRRYGREGGSPDILRHKHDSRLNHGAGGTAGRPLCRRMPFSIQHLSRAAVAKRRRNEVLQKRDERHYAQLSRTAAERRRTLEVKARLLPTPSEEDLFFEFTHASSCQTFTVARRLTGRT